MTNVKTMTYRELEDELRANHIEMRTASLERKRLLVNRDYDLMTEMDARWEKIDDWYKK